MYNIICGAPYNNQAPLLSLHGQQANIFLNMGFNNTYINKHLPSSLCDLIDIATYLYCIDSQMSFEDTPSSYKVVIPVRDTLVWNNPFITHKLLRTLQILSYHQYDITFSQFIASEESEAIIDDYHKPPVNPSTHTCVFGTGIDSLAGVLYDLKFDDNNLTLLGFHDSDKQLSIQQKLFSEIKYICNTVNYIPIKITSPHIPQDFEGKLRAFLFSSIGLAISYLLGKDELTIYENGISNLNLTTHDCNTFTLPSLTNPLFVERFQGLLSALTARKFNIRNPFRWYTKQELLETISLNHYKELITYSSSCSKVSYLPGNKTHCGECKKCLERRLAILGAKLQEHDPVDLYLYDIFLDNWHDNNDIYAAKDFVHMASNIYHMNLNNFLREYPQIYDITASSDNTRPIQNIFSFLKRHATNVHNVIVRTIKKYASKIFEGQLPPKSMLFAITNRHSSIGSPLSQEQISISKALIHDIDITPKQFCEFAINSEHKSIVISGGIILVGTEYRLIILLLPLFLKAQNNRCTCQPTKAADLASEIYNGDEISLRKLISRINQKIAYGTAIRMNIDIGPHGFIENVRSQGYRINPSVKILATYGSLMEDSSHSN